MPARVDAGLDAVLGQLRTPLVTVLHCNHAQEISDGVREAAAVLRRHSTTLLNQAVLLRGVNDSADALVALSEALFAVGVLPYYLHQLDRVAGAAHFAVDDERARQLVSAAAARLPGYLVPRLVREVPGTASKLPL
jgi:KamA family protein